MADEISQVSDELGQPDYPLSSELESEEIQCPYCGYRASPEEFITDERNEYLVGVIEEKIIRPALEKMFGSIARTTATSSLSAGSSGLFMSSTHSVPPPMPLEGPEPNDMISVKLLCCGRRVKVFENWYDIDHCPYCGTSIKVESYGNEVS